MNRIRKALISVWDKTELVPFVRGLQCLGVQIISTGGTAKLLKGQGIPVKEVADFTGSPEMLGGRVKTLHPKVHGGILARRGDKKHLAQARRLGLQLIDLVVVNLYPFEGTAQRRGVPLKELMEQIDIGGVALMRSAAKNFESVAVLTSPSQYEAVLDELILQKGALSEKTRMKLAVEAFAETAYYDSVIRETLSRRQKSVEAWPRHIVFGASKRQELRYGENPHQQGAWYQWPALSGAPNGLSSARQLHGKELSFNNLLDLSAALEVVSAFQKPCAAVVKHMNPCGVACAATPVQAFQRAFACDPMSAFGGIVGLNRPVDAKAAKAIVKSGFLECLIAPGFHEGALELLRTAKKNLRILEISSSALSSASSPIDIKPISGGLLVQGSDYFEKKPSSWRLVTTAKPSAAQRRDLSFAWVVAKFVRSNAIVVAKNEATVGIGAGQMSRVDSVRVALRKAGARCRGAVLASDGFFPKPDGPQHAVKAGVKAIVQPGGSIQDPAVIQTAEKARVPMLLTGERHFRH